VDAVVDHVAKRTRIEVRDAGVLIRRAP
jgi:hypothetical protein